MGRRVFSEFLGGASEESRFKRQGSLAEGSENREKLKACNEGHSGQSKTGGGQLTMLDMETQSVTAVLLPNLGNRICFKLRIVVHCTEILGILLFFQQGEGNFKNRHNVYNLYAEYDWSKLFYNHWSRRKERASFALI